MLIGELEDIIKRNETYPQTRFVASRWGRRQGAPEGTLTIVVGDWPMTYKHGKAYLSPEHKAAYNVSYPFVPRYSIVSEDGSIETRGYISLLTALLADRVIRPTKEIQRVFGDDWSGVPEKLGLSGYEMA